GKLSDFAGLFFFPVLLVVLAEWLFARVLGRHRAVLSVIAVLLTGIVFSALKTIPALSALFNAHVGSMVRDTSDLAALASLPPSYLYLTRHLPRAPAPRWARFLAVALAGLASMATSPLRIMHGFAVWEIQTRETKHVGCADVDVWVSKSGKAG